MLGNLYPTLFSLFWPIESVAEICLRIKDIPSIYLSLDAYFMSLYGRSCLGVVGCEWCQLHSDGVSLLSMPFCAHQDFCYNGVATADSSTRKFPFNCICSI